jgi:uncharacterized protein involved in exopolysaccharide biosynthesis
VDRTSTASLLRAGLRHRKKMAAFFLAVMGTVAGATLLCPRSYRSEAKLLLRLGRENVTVDPTATMGQAPVVAVPPSREADINSLIEILRSKVLIEKVVDLIGPRVILGKEAYQKPGGAARPKALPDQPDFGPDRYRAVRELAKALDVEHVKKSNVVSIYYEGPSPDLAQAVVAALVEFSFDQHLALHRTPQAHQFFAEQAERLRSQLSRSEEKLRDLKNETGLVSPEAQRQVLVTRIARLEDELAQTSNALAAAEAEAAALRENAEALAKTQVTAHMKGLPNQAADTMRAQLYALELKELDLRGKFADSHPEVRMVREQIAAAKNILAREEAAREQVTVGPSRPAEETQLALVRLGPGLASLRAKEKSLRVQLARERAALKEFNEDVIRLGRLQREVDQNEAHYRKYADNLEQSQIDETLKLERISNISVVQPATRDPKPTRPRLLLNLTLGLVFGLGGAVAVALLAERRLGAPNSGCRHGEAPAASAARFGNSTNGVHAPLP